MSNFENLLQQIQSAEAQLIEGFHSIGRAMQPLVDAANKIATRCKSNKRVRRALRRGNIAQWVWYVGEHVRRCE